MEYSPLSSVVLKLLLIGLGWLLVRRGTRLKETGDEPAGFLSPNAIIVIGFVIIVLNALQILWIMYAGR